MAWVMGVPVPAEDISDQPQLLLKSEHISCKEKYV